MAKITTGSSFGLNIPQTQACRLMAEGYDIPAIILMTKGVTKTSDRKMYDRARKELVKWMALPGWAECYRAIVRERAMPSYGKAVSVIDKQMDSANEWIAQGAAREALTRFGPAIMGEDSNAMTIKIEGMPHLGMPGQPAQQADE